MAIVNNSLLLNKMDLSYLGVHSTFLCSRTSMTDRYCIRKKMDTNSAKG
jgi:hypothetical protein